METQTEQKIPTSEPLTTEEDFRKKFPKEALDILPPDFFQQLNGEPKGQVVLFPDITKLFNTILLSTPKTKEAIEARVKEIKAMSNGMKLWAVKFPFENEGGGVLSYLLTRDLPFRGVPHKDAVERLGFTKRIITTIIKSLPIKTLIIHYVVLFLISRKKFENKISSIFQNFLDYAYNSLFPFRLEDLRYCCCVQETRRTISEMIKRHEWKWIAERFKDVLSLFVENDNAYRFRYQDFWQIANIKILASGNKKEFLREINRIFEEIKKRENIRLEKIQNWQKKKMLILFLFRIKKYRELFQEFCQIVNVEKLLFTPEDREFIKNRTDYMFEGKLLWKMVPLWQGYLEKYKNRIERTTDKEKLKMLKKNYDIIKYHLDLYGGISNNN